MKYFNNELFMIKGVPFTVKLFPRNQVNAVCNECALLKTPFPCLKVSNFCCYAIAYGEYVYMSSLNEIYHVSSDWYNTLLPRTQIQSK